MRATPLWQPGQWQQNQQGGQQRQHPGGQNGDQHPQFDEGQVALTVEVDQRIDLAPTQELGEEWLFIVNRFDPERIVVVELCSFGPQNRIKKLEQGVILQTVEALALLRVEVGQEDRIKGPALCKRPDRGQLSLGVGSPLDAKRQGTPATDSSNPVLWSCDPRLF